MKTLLLFVGEEGFNIKAIKDTLVSYFGTRTISNMLDSYPAIELREFSEVDEAFINSVLASVNVTAFAIQDLGEDFKNKNILYLRSYDFTQK